MKTKFTLPVMLFAAFSILFISTAYTQPTFFNEIPIPPLLDAADGIIELEMKQTLHKFNPGDSFDTPLNDSLNGTTNQNGIVTWAYNLKGTNTMTFLGPTLKWHTGEMTSIRVNNMLPDTTTTHWHGAEVPPEFDGGPHQPILMGDTWPVDFTNLDNASTLWYHPHLHNKTLPQVQRGLSGIVISEQADDLIRFVVPRTYGVDDIPIIIGDLGVVYDEDLDSVYIIPEKGKRPFNIVNGVTNPYLEIPNALVRLRILNGSTRKGIQIGISESYTNDDLASMEDFVLIASDGGYTLKPDTFRTLLTGPGARDEIILDLTDYFAGDVLYLRNLNEIMNSSVVGTATGNDPTRGKAFLQLRVIDKDGIPNYTPITTFTDFITDWDPTLQDTLNIDRRRTKKLVFIPKDLNANPPRPHNAFTIDSTTYDMMVINDTICEGAKEIWTIHNETATAHPFHIHKIFFRVLDIDSMGVSIDPASRGYNGPKDDVLVLPNWKLRFMAKFDDYPRPIDPTNGYMYHCHILTHEDQEGGGMMHQFVVTSDLACLVGIKEEALQAKEMTLFPNPATFELFMKASSSSESKVQILDLQGRVLKDQTLPPFEEQTTIDIQSIPPGFYIVSWQTEEGTASRKLILN